MDEELRKSRTETAAHRELKRLALLWAQAQGYSACAVEVSLPQCRYRADVAAYRPGPNRTTAIFECKQARPDLRPDLRRDNCSTPETKARLQTVQRRRQLLEQHLRIHYPGLRVPDSLFPEFDSHNFAAIGHRNYSRVVRELEVLHRRLHGCAKFETMIKYGCANLFFLVLPNDLYRDPDIPLGWGALVRMEGGLRLLRRPTWHDLSPERTTRFLERIARAGTRVLNQQLQISFDEVRTERSHSLPEYR